MGTFLVGVLVSAMLPQLPSGAAPRPGVPAAAVPAAARTTDALDSGLVLIAPGVPLERGFGLGDGGVGDRRTALRTSSGAATTPGGVQVLCRKEGVKLTFPSGRELLVATDGYVHLRDGSVGGPFDGGIQLLLADGARVDIALGGSRRTPLREVVVRTGDADDGVLLWRRNEPVAEAAHGAWNGDRAFCLGDGGALYRGLALGPVITLQRLLAPRDATKLPSARLALQGDLLLQALRTLADSRAHLVNPEAVTEVEVVLAHAATVLPADGQAPPRIGSDPLRFLLRAGYDLQFETDGGEISMTMARHGQRAFVEWHIGYGSAVRCVEASMQSSGSLIGLPAVAPVLRPRLERMDLVRAVQVLREVARD